MSAKMPPKPKHYRRGAKSTKGATESGDVCSIDALPDGVLQHIIGFLPAQEAVRTSLRSLLARRWRNLWISTTGLRIIGGENDNMNKLRQFVDHLLLLRGGAPLETCELRFCTAMSDGFSDDDMNRVSLWFRHALRCQARVLRLLIGLGDYYFDLDGFRLVSRHLMELEIHRAQIMETSLNFSSCPTLEQLVLKGCDLSLTKNISSESLKRLSITSCLFSETFRARIAAPCLVSFQLDGNFERTPVVENMPAIVDAFIQVLDPSVDGCLESDSTECDACHDMIQSNNESVLLEGLSKSKNLTLIDECKTLIFKMDLKRCPTFSNLKTLLLRDPWCVALNLDVLTCILEHSPVLEKLTLELFQEDPDDKVEMKGSYNPAQRSIATSEHLKIVEVKCKVVDQRVSKILKLLCTFNISFGERAQLRLRTR